MRVLRDARQTALLDQLRQLEKRRPPSWSENHIAAMLALAESDAPAFSRDFFQPGHFTASAFVLSPKRDELLLIFHKKLRMWLQPGGHVEPTDRDLLSAARRELREETGLVECRVLDSLFDLDVHEIPAYDRFPAHKHHDVRVLLVAEARQVEAGDDAAEARWFPLQVVAEKGAHLGDGFGTDASVQRVARQLITGAESVFP